MRVGMLLAAALFLAPVAVNAACRQFSDPMPNLVANADPLEVRAGPGSSHEKVATLRHAKGFQVEEVCGEWARLDRRIPWGGTPASPEYLKDGWVHLPQTCIAKGTARAFNEGWLPKESRVVSEVCSFDVLY